MKTLTQARIILKEQLDNIFDSQRIDGLEHVGIGYDKCCGYFIQAVQTWEESTEIDVDFIEKAGIRMIKGTSRTHMIEPESRTIFDGPLPSDFPTIQPGISLNKGGALGCIVYRGEERFILSNDHVLRKFDEGTRLNIPALSDESNNVKIGEYEREPLNRELDCALSKIESRVFHKVSDKLKFLNIVPDQVAPPFLHLRVVKYGPISGFQNGYIRLIDVYKSKKQFGVFKFFEVQPSFDSHTFADEGDSGSLILLADNMSVIVGMVVSRAEFDPCGDPQNVKKGCLAISIIDVLKFLNVSLTKI